MSNCAGRRNSCPFPENIVLLILITYIKFNRKGGFSRMLPLQKRNG